MLFSVAYWAFIELHGCNILNYYSWDAPTCLFCFRRLDLRLTYFTFSFLRLTFRAFGLFWSLTMEGILSIQVPDRVKTKILWVLYIAYILHNWCMMIIINNFFSTVTAVSTKTWITTTANNQIKSFMVIFNSALFHSIKLLRHFKVDSLYHNIKW